MLMFVVLGHWPATAVLWKGHLVSQKAYYIIYNKIFRHNEKLMKMVEL